MSRAHWGNGAAAAVALKRAAGAAFGDLEGVERVEALVDADDSAARGVLEDAGFRLEAVLRSYRAVEGRLTDVAVYSVISTDPLLD
jgi:RimJ/RimL family protein N-acetyltransferase